MKTKRRGFSLIELLVVTALIALLVSMLLPALQKAKGSAHKIACVNNLKQTGYALSQYTDDYCGWFPIACDDGAKYSNPNHTWDWFLDPYLSGGKKNANGIRIKPCLICPTDNLGRSSAALEALGRRSYAVNLHIMWDWTKPYPQRRLQELKHPSQIPVLLEYVKSGNVQCYGSDYSIWEETDPLYFNARHGKQSNLLLADNHVETHLMSVIRDLNRFRWRPNLW